MYLQLFMGIKSIQIINPSLTSSKFLSDLKHILNKCKGLAIHQVLLLSKYLSSCEITKATLKNVSSAKWFFKNISSNFKARPVPADGLALLAAKASAGAVISKLQWHLTHLPLDKMATILQMTFSNAFLEWKCLIFLQKLHWSLFLRIQFTINQQWFRWWLGTE